MKLIDTHTHVNLRAYKDDAKETIQRAHDAGVVVINVGTQIDTSRQAVEMLAEFPEDVYAVVGMHPSHTYEQDFHDEDEVETKTHETGFNVELYKNLADNSRVVGIGECGLDYYRLPENQDHGEIKKLQKDAFEAQIALALQLDKALCIHCRPSDGTTDAYEDLLAIITKVKAENPQLRFEVHCFTGDLEIAQKFVDLGGYIGINGIITFDKTTRSKEVVNGLPLEAIILETDAPYLSPKIYRGKRNEPAYLVEVARQIADWKNVTVEEVANVTTANAKKLFKL